MPTPWWKKERVGGITRLLVCSLRSKAKRDSPLVLQAGFPTSVADLLVKNRSRLRKAPGWGRQRRPPVDAGCSTMANLTSEILAAASASALDQPPPTSPRSLPPENLEPLIGTEVPKNEAVRGISGSKLLGIEGGFDDLHGSEATKGVVNLCIPPQNAEKDEFFQASASSKVPKAETPQCPPMAEERKREASGVPPVPREAQRKDFGGGTSGGFMVIAKAVFIVVVLAVLSKKIAVAISGLAFAFLFAESIGRHVISLLGPCKEAKRSLGGTIVASVSISELTRAPAELGSKGCGGFPIRLAHTGETDLRSFNSESDWGVEEPFNAAAPAVGMAFPALEENLHVEIEGGRGDQEVSCAERNGNKKKKKLFRNFVPTRFRGSKVVKGGKIEGKSEPASDSGSVGSHGWKGTSLEKALEEEDEEEEDSKGADDGKDGEGGGLGLQIPAMAHELGLEDAAIAGAEAMEPAKGISSHLVFFAVILCGLIGGRMTAMALTVLWYLLVSSARRLWRSWNSHRCLKAVPDASTSEAVGIGGRN